MISKVTKRLDVPGEAGQQVEIRMLSWVQLNEARKERIKEIIGMRDVFALLKDIPNGASPETAAPADPLQNYDRLSLLRAAIVSWTYDIPVNAEDLDVATAEWLAHEVLEYASPGDAQTKGSASRSTGT